VGERASLDTKEKRNISYFFQKSDHGSLVIQPSRLVTVLTTL